ncbi:SspB family protein [Methylocapsa palsarum]|uniref:Stringent starvation protein B n=1 Tax=Methylocapsa palsarum TaxID=1612308 RepID=A0A1I3ZTU6_9HYPH|nr:ClpXP protease specificity-enhancing factor SspB [Methylocapsa palsarum]SFK47111.1 hypothetical protein SAMN05444581_108153 [Methylocapsa palsarum]
MATDLIRYDVLVQEALRGVVRKALGDAARDGLPGEHHFYITFRTHARGVRLSARMRERYPDEMTIILQHQFWGLSVTEHAFEVGLSFQNTPEMLLIPFDAVTRFSDPAVEFDLKFELEDEAAETGANDAGSPRGGKAGGPELAPVLTAVRTLASADAQTSKPAGAGGGDRSQEFGPELPEGEGAPEPGEAKVVSIDAFRKKP